MPYRVRGLCALVGGALFVAGGYAATQQLLRSEYPQGGVFPLAVATSAVGFGVLCVAFVRPDR